MINPKSSGQQSYQPRAALCITMYLGKNVNLGIFKYNNVEMALKIINNICISWSCIHRCTPATNGTAFLLKTFSRALSSTFLCNADTAMPSKNILTWLYVNIKVGGRGGLYYNTIKSLIDQGKMWHLFRRGEYFCYPGALQTNH